MKLIAALVAASLSQAGFALVIAFCVQSVFDAALLHRANATPLWPLAAVFSAAALAAAGLEMWRAWLGERLSLGYTAELRAALFSQIMRASASTVSEKRQGSLLLPFVGDLTAIKRWVSDGLVRVISASVTSLIILAALAAHNLILAEAAVGVMLAAGGAALWLSGPLSRAIEDMRNRRGAVANFVSSSIRAAASIQAFNRLSREQGRLERRNDKLTKSGLRLAQLSGAMSAVVHLAATMLVGLTLLIGVVEVDRGAMTVGLVAAAISLAGLLAGSVRDLGVSFELWRRAQVSFTKLAAKLDLAPSMPAPAGASRLRQTGHGLRLEAVAVADHVRKANVRAKPGAVIRVTGATPAARSAFLAVIARMREPDAGRILLHGRDLKGATEQSLRQRIGWASMSAPLLRGSIQMNLTYGRPGANAQSIEAVIAACHLKPLIDRLPDGGQTRLNDDAGQLSRGEIQQLLIARALLGPPAMLVMDDVDSHLDEDAAAAIGAALSAYKGIVVMSGAHPILTRAVTTIWNIESGAVRSQDLRDILVANVARHGARAAS